MKILLGYSYYKNPIDVKQWVEKWLHRLNEAGIKVDPFCLTLDAPGARLSWNELDKRWKQGDDKLFLKYRNLLEKFKDYDVFINWNGINLHPEFVKMIPIFKVYSCYDDPESSEDLSKPVASRYDLCLVGNIAELSTYRSWGVENVEFWPLGYFEEERDLGITAEQILSDERNIDVSILCERVTNWRKERLDKFTKAFPNGSYYGRGWPNGFIAEEKKLDLYRKTKIGLNIHNSTGPINFRTYMLPANGVMLLCDNKSDLAKLYKLGEEAIGFNTIEEAIELCKYYLKNDHERKIIALAGWEKAINSYNEVSSFKMGLSHIKRLYIKNNNKIKDIDESMQVLHRYKNRAKIKYFVFIFWVNIIKKIYRRLLK